MNWEEEFHKFLGILARQTKYELDEAEIALFDKALAPYGYQKCVYGIQKVLFNRRTRDGFPSIADLRQAVNPTLAGPSAGQVIADKIWGCIGKYGYTWPRQDGIDFKKELLSEFGPAGALAIKNLGGWGNLCESSNRTDHGTMKAQIRNSVQAVIEMREAGFETPEKMIGNQNAEVARLASKVTKSLPGSDSPDPDRV